ncbi:MAG: DUF4145 domain-containing protein [Acidobacteria bacterium]|nr:DUF4145 domain-containing protein [Acidobacteriota bacterium]
MEKKFRLANRSVSTPADPPSINLRCPECHRLGSFDTLKNTHDIVVQSQGDFQGNLYVGYRVCPNTSCNLLMFVAFQQVRQPALEAKVLVSYPAERIDFDASNIPQPIVDALEEAITCHSCAAYTASAIMIRKSLEELCREKNAQGKRLVDQIKDIGSKIILPNDLINGIDNLRLLGNDAAHVELKYYDKIDKEEVEVGIEFTKEILKAVYQYSLLVSRLEGLKKKAPPTT